MLKDTVQKQMMDAMKDHNKKLKTTLSMLYSALKNKEIDKKGTLTEDEEFAVVSKMVKQVQESIDCTPTDRLDKIEDLKKELEVYKQFLPKQMSEEDIQEVIESVLSDLNTYSKKDKGKIMKELMPRVRGKADGKLVNNILSTYLK